MPSNVHTVSYDDSPFWREVYEMLKAGRKSLYMPRVDHPDSVQSLLVERCQPYGLKTWRYFTEARYARNRADRAFYLGMLATLMPEHENMLLEVARETCG